ncbi:MAG TPA: LysR family transcriptional regulator [Alphaproteobacteria bacterium]|nr:LysR family transcriptional regulator [Alphaproteobacteria bacterium]
MARPDLNLLATLDVLLSEGSVARAAKRLRLSPSAMSRTLARLRETTGDPLLVRAGRGLVPTPRALELRGQVGPLVEAAEAALRPAQAVDLKTIARTFTLRASEGFAETFGPDLIARIRQDAPGLRLRFMQKPDRDSAPLREGEADLETGVVGEATSPELRMQALFRDRFVGVVRQGHALSRGKMTAARYAAADHVLASRRGNDRDRIDDLLKKQQLERTVAVIVGGFATAIALARHSDLVASVPERHTANLREGLCSFALPVAMPQITVSLLWHPRMDADPAHRWLRERLREICAERR